MESVLNIKGNIADGLTAGIITLALAIANSIPSELGELMLVSRISVSDCARVFTEAFGGTKM